MTLNDTIFNEIFGIPRTNTGNYPPYNIVKVGEASFIIEMAVAGLDEDDFNITLKGRTLRVECNPSGLSEDDIYLHKGISTRPFTKEFILSRGVEITNVEMINGMLTIKLRREIPEEEKVREFKINPGVKELLNE